MSDKSENAIEYQLRIVRKEGSTSPTFSNNFVVQANGPEFHIRFYQLSPPIFLGDTLEEKAAELDAMHGEVDANCVAHIVVSRDRMKELVGLFVDQARRYLDMNLVEATPDKDAAK